VRGRNGNSWERGGWSVEVRRKWGESIGREMKRGKGSDGRK
jgi:hypothetical protein